MPGITMTRELFLRDSRGHIFADVVNDPRVPFDQLLDFLNDPDRQRRMEESEIHHDRPPLAGIVRELESESFVSLNRSLAGRHARSNHRLRRAINVAVLMIMERLGWRSSGRKGFLGARAKSLFGIPRHNVRGLSFWFARGERFELCRGMPYRSVEQRGEEFEWTLTHEETQLDVDNNRLWEASSLEEFAIKAGDPLKQVGEVT